MNSKNSVQKIAFCTSAMNRLWQVRETLSNNLKILKDSPHFIALCNFNSSDGLDEFIKTHFQQEMRSGKLAYFYTTEPMTFHMSVAKNTSHRLGLKYDPTILFNLDADNFISEKSLENLEAEFSDNPMIVMHEWTMDWEDGSCGRIALTPESWQRLGGYDEGLLPMTYQDLDLLNRCCVIGLKYKRNPAEDTPSPIKNTSDHKMSKINVDLHGISSMSSEELYNHFAKLNMIRTMERPHFLQVASQKQFSGILNFSRQIDI